MKYPWKVFLFFGSKNGAGTTMNSYTIRFHKQTYRALENSYTCVRALHCELELEVMILQKSRKMEPCSATTKTNKNSSHIWRRIRGFEPGLPGWQSKSFTFAQTSLLLFFTDSKLELYRRCGHNRLKG